MEKLKKHQNGFAMAELLMVVVVILFISTILFSNYLSLLGGYEQKTLYNNVTSQYASFYLRKTFKNVFESDIDYSKYIIDAVENNGYYEVYSLDKKLDDNKYRNSIQNIIDEYGIDQIIITKNDISNLKEKYPRNKVLYRYIDYLPKANEKDLYEELYRIILKTKEYGYATTAILTEELSGLGCFDLDYTSDGFIIKSYHSEKETCDLDVEITSSEYTVGKNKGVIYKIADSAFKNKGITSITISDTVTEIGSSAFENNKLKKVTISNIIYGEKVFSNNPLEEIIIEDDVTKISKSMFENSKSSDKNIELSIGSSVKEIADSAFKNTGIGSVSFSGSSLEIIGNESFYGNNLKSFEFPTSIKKVGNNIFGNTSLGNKEGEITALYNDESKILDDDNINWCYVLYDRKCTRSEADTLGYKYTSISTSKYITYVLVGDNNE